MDIGQKCDGKSGKSTSLKRTIRGQRIEGVAVVEQEVAKTGKSEGSRAMKRMKSVTMYLFAMVMNRLADEVTQESSSKSNYDVCRYCILW